MKLYYILYMTLVCANNYAMEHTEAASRKIASLKELAITQILIPPRSLQERTSFAHLYECQKNISPVIRQDISEQALAFLCHELVEGQKRPLFSKLSKEKIEHYLRYIDLEEPIGQMILEEIIQRWPANESEQTFNKFFTSILCNPTAHRLCKQHYERAIEVALLNYVMNSQSVCKMHIARLLLDHRLALSSDTLSLSCDTIIKKSCQDNVTGHQVSELFTLLIQANALTHHDKNKLIERVSTKILYGNDVYQQLFITLLQAGAQTNTVSHQAKITMRIH